MYLFYQVLNRMFAKCDTQHAIVLERLHSNVIIKTKVQFLKALIWGNGVLYLKIHMDSQNRCVYEISSC